MENIAYAERFHRERPVAVDGGEHRFGVNGFSRRIAVFPFYREPGAVHVEGLVQLREHEFDRQIRLLDKKIPVAAFAQGVVEFIGVLELLFPVLNAVFEIVERIVSIAAKDVLLTRRRSFADRFPGKGLNESLRSRYCRTALF